MAAGIQGLTDKAALRLSSLCGIALCLGPWAAQVQSRR